MKQPIIFQTEYNEDTSEHLRASIEDKFQHSRKDRELLIDYPTVYVIEDQKGKRDQYSVYVGETNDIQRRTIQHIADDPKKRADFKAFNKSKRTRMYVIGHEYFNKSMTLDIENRLMQYLSGVPAVYRLNNRRNNDQNKYYDSEQFKQVFDSVWMKLHQKNKNLFPAQEIIETSALFKASPFNKLTEEQLKAKSQIINEVNRALVSARQHPDQPSQLILVKGNAGSGKTVLMSSIFYDLVSENQRVNEEDSDGYQLKASMIVNQEEQLTVYQQIAKKLNIGDKNNVLKPATFIKRVSPDKKVDIAFIDEAHLLLTQNNQAFAKEYGTNMLKAIFNRAKVVIAIFDPMQVLSYQAVWDKQQLADLNRLAGRDNIIVLKNQMRIQASAKKVAWLDNVIKNGRIDRLPKVDDHYEVKVFDTPDYMEQAIIKKNQDQDMGISRMVATFDWDYSGGKTEPTDGKYWSVKVGDWSMPWNYEERDRGKYEKHHRNVKYKDLSWAEKDYTVNEIGSTYTVQGSDLNYVGVVIGPSVKFRDGRIIHDPAASKNSKATNKRGSKISYAQELLKNEFNVLMTRGVHGLYLYAVDPELQAELKKTID